MAWLNKAQAERQAERLAYHIRKYGVPVSINLRRGAGNSGYWGTDTFYGAMAHHIVSRRSHGTTPFYNLVRNGRSDVPGPLANIYGGWDMRARIITMGLANHPGAGGPWVISGFRIPKDNGRHYFLGTEFEGGLNERDWTPEYREFMGKVNAGKIDYIRELRRGITIRDTALCEHSDWARPKGRKIDRLNYTQAKGIKEMQAARATLNKPAPKPPAPAPKPPAPPPKENPLTDVSNQDAKRIADAVGPAVADALSRMAISSSPDGPANFAQSLYRTQSELMRLSDQVANQSELIYATFKQDDEGAEDAIDRIRRRGVHRAFLPEDER